MTYPFEWSAPGLRDAALLWIDLNLELVRHNLATLDSHPWNILFDGSSPRFVDIGSLAPLDDVDLNAVWAEFRGYFLHPLHLMAMQQRRIARNLLKDFTQPVSREEFNFMSRRRPRLLNTIEARLTDRLRHAAPSVKNVLRRTRDRFRKLSENAAGSKQGYFRKVLEKLRAEVLGVDFRPTPSSWVNYYETFTDFEKRQDWSSKQSEVWEALDRFKPKSVLDIGSNTGWYSQLATRAGSRVVSLEMDEACLDRMYTDAASKKLSLIPLSMDIRNPSPAYGWNRGVYRSAEDRLGSDCVLALALVHHLVFRQLGDFELVVDALSRFTRRNLIVEFISKEDSWVREWWNEGYSWYTLENFLTCLRKSFREAVVLPVAGPRILIACEK